MTLYEKAKLLATEKDTAEKIRIVLAESAKILASDAIEREIKREITEQKAKLLAMERDAAEKTRIHLAEGAKILASDAIERELKREIAEQKAKFLAIEKNNAEETRIHLAEGAKILASDAIEKEQEKQIAEDTRIELLEHAKVLANIALTKEFEKELAERVRVKLSEYAKVLAIDVLKKDIERNLAEDTRIILSNHAKILAGEVITTNELVLQMKLDRVSDSELYAIMDRANLENRASMAEMSHEIRNPLHGVIGIIELMSDIELIPEIKEYVDGLKELSKMLLNVVNDVLDISKLDCGKLQIESILYHPYTIINDICIVYSSIVESKGLHLLHDVDKDMDVVGDPHRIKQILNNLMSNAIKFTEQGDITIKAEKIGEYIIYSVSDSGNGISNINLGKLFQPYSQLDVSTSRLYGGSGLGLSICKKLVDLMDGEIGADSREGIGSTIWIKIPCQN